MVAQYAAFAFIGCIWIISSFCFVVSSNLALMMVSKLFLKD